MINNLIMSFNRNPESIGTQSFFASYAIRLVILGVKKRNSGVLSV